MRVLRNRPPQAPRSRWIFVCTEIYPRVAPIWVSALPWMEDFAFFYICFTFIFESKARLSDEREMGSQKAAAMAVGKEAQQRRQSRKLRRVQQRSPAEQQQLRGATALTGGSATARVSSKFRQHSGCQ